MRRPPAALVVGLSGLAAVALLLEVLGVPPADGVRLVGFSGGGALAAGLAGTGVLRLMPQSRFAVQMTVVVVAGVVAVAAGALAAASKMLLPAGDLHRFVVVVVSAGTVGAFVSLTLSARVREAQSSLAAATRRLADDGAPVAATPPPIREFAAIAAELEQTRRRLAESRQRERRLDAARRELITWLSHDLRTPLAGIRALTEALEDGVVSDADEVAASHRRLREQAERLADMVEDLFALSRIHSGVVDADRSRVALGDLVSDAVAAAEALAARAGVHVDAWCRQPVDVLVAPAEIARLLDNLLSNAIRETPRGGRVRVVVDAGADRAEVTVTDECGGIDPDVLPRVFDAGYRGALARTPATDAGGGFGLTIARGLAEAHDGSLDVRNTDGGCQLRLSLPGGPVEAARRPGPAGAVSPRALRGAPRV